MLLLLPSTITLALMDSLNPSTIAAQVFLLLGVKKPVSRVVSFILGTFVMYTAFGFVVVFVIGQPIKGYIYDMGSTDYIILLAIGIILIAVGTALVFSRYIVKGGHSKSEGYMRKAMAPMLAMLKTLNPVHTFFFGMGTTAFDLPTSAFYFVAIASIIEAGTDPYEMIVLLLLYNLLYILPLVLILFIYLIAKNRSEPLMNRINMAISKWSGRLTMLFLFLIGVILVVLSVSFFLNWHLI
jgi:cytochrome c biogenesis protein CcdA